MNVTTSIGVYDYHKKKLCELYDSSGSVRGQAYNISWTKNIDGISTLTFSIPYLVDGETNFRWKYLKSEYLIKMVRGDKTEWFIASKPAKSKSNKEIIGTATCNGFAAILKTKNIYMQFDDENGIGPIQDLIRKILSGTGWTLGHYDTMYERDGITEMVRSLKSDGKQGALGLINTVCNLFKCYPVYDSDQMKVNIYSLNRHENAIEMEVGRNTETIAVNYNSDDIVTRLYVEGEYAEDGYVGIDDVNPTGLNYLFNFDYYKEIGLFDEEHDLALHNYLRDIKGVKNRISANQEMETEFDNAANDLVGQCIIALYYTNDSWTTPKYTYGTLTDTQKKMGILKLEVGDEVVVLNSNGTHRYETIETTPQALIRDGDYGIAKFAKPASGSIGAAETQVTAKEKEIANLEQKISSTVKPEKIAEYQREIAQLESQIDVINEGVTMYDQETIRNVMKPYIPADYNGNADMTNRVIVPAQTFINAGWEDFDGDYGTIYSQSYSAGTTEEYDFPFPKNIVFSVTPVYANGTVLSPQAIDDYVYSIVTTAASSGASLLDVDPYKLVLRVYELENGETLDQAFTRQDAWDVNLHNLQADGDMYRAKYDFFLMKSQKDPAGIFDDVPRTNGLYEMMQSMMKSDGLLYHINEHQRIYEALVEEQLEIEADFAIAMGNMLRDGYWQDNNYVQGQEDALYADALKMSEQMGKPEVTYSLRYIRAPESVDRQIDELAINDIVHLIDDELEINENLYMRKIVIGIDKENEGSLDVNNNEVSLSGKDLGSILSRMSRLSDLIDQKNALYDRAKAINSDGSIFTDRLEGRIDLLKTRLSSTASNWYTDEMGNLIFLSADGSGAMMLCGAGFMISNGRDDDGEFRWRTFGTSEGFTADEIVAGFLSADRIEAGTISTQKLTPLVGQELDLSENESIERNTYIQMLPDQIVTYVGEKGYGRTFISLTDPALDPANDVHPGDYWVKQDPDLEQKTWEYCHQKTWEGVDQHVWYEFVVDPRNWGYNYYKTWGELSKDNWYALIDSVADMYCRKGTGENGEWIIVNDRSILSEAYTRITQNKDAIIQEAYRANAAEGELHSEIIQTADSITTMVERTYFTKTAATQMANELTDQAIELANNAAESAKAASIAKTTRYQSADAIVETAVAVVDLGDTSMLPEFNENTQYYKGNAVKYNSKGYLFTQDHKGAWDPNHVKEIMPYIAQTTRFQTADALASEAIKTASTNIAPEFSTSKRYEIGDLVSYTDNSGNTKIYRFKVVHTPGAWNPNHVDDVSASTSFIQKTSIYQTANDILLKAEEYTNNNAYAKVSYIDIKAAGIELKGNTYLKLNAGCYIECSASQIKFSTTDTLADEMNKKSNITTMTPQYYHSTSATELKGGSWSTTQPAHVDGKFIWTRTEVSYSNTTNKTYTPSETGICVEGVPGPQGQQGAPGANGKDGTNGTNGKDGKDGKDGTNGTNGKDGVGIKSMTVHYALSTSDSVAPSADSSSWQETVPEYVAGKFYWTKTTVTYTDNNVTYFFACDNGSNYACKKAADAYTEAHDIAIGQTGVPYVNSDQFIIQNGDITVGATSTVGVYGNSELTFGCAASNSAMKINKNGVSIGAAKDIAIVAAGSLSLQGSAGISLNSGSISMTSGNITMSGGKLNLTGGELNIKSGGKLNLTGVGGIVVTGENVGGEILGGVFEARGGVITALDGRDYPTIWRFEHDGLYFFVEWAPGNETMFLEWSFFRDLDNTFVGALAARSSALYITSEDKVRLAANQMIFENFNSVMSTGGFRMFYESANGAVLCFWKYDQSGANEKSTLGYPNSQNLARPFTNGYITNIYGTIRGSSSKAIKHNITEIKSNGEVLDKLSPITFIYNDDKENVQHSGLIYEDTVGVMPEICHDDGVTKSICYVELVPYLLKEIQDLRRRVKQLEK